MSVPLVHRDQLLGVLNVNAALDDTFQEYELRALSIFGEHAASTIANAPALRAGARRHGQRSRTAPSTTR